MAQCSAEKRFPAKRDQPRMAIPTDLLTFATHDDPEATPA